MPDPEAVAYSGVNVKFRRYSSSFQCQVEFRQSLSDVWPVVFAAYQKSSWRFFGESHVAGNRGVDQGLERRFRTLAFNWVGAAWDRADSLGR